MLSHQRLLMQCSYTIDVAEDASAIADIEPLSFSSAEFSDTEAWQGEHFMDIIDDEDIPEAWLEENFMDITDDEDIHDAFFEESFLDITVEAADLHSLEVWVEENCMSTMDDEDIIPLLNASAVADIEPLSFSSAEFSDTEAWPGEHFTDIIDDEDIPEAWLEENFMGITDDEDIHDAFFEEDFLDIAVEVADLHSLEVWLEENCMPTMDDEYSIPLLDASFLDQVASVPTQQPFEDSSTRKVRIPEWIFLTINVLIELLSAAFDQLSSVNKPRYALIAMLMSAVAAITCISELAYRAGKERVTWRWKSKFPWFYYPSPSHRRFGTFPEMIGLVSAMLQTIISVIAYTFYLRHADCPLKVSFWPVVFALGLFCSKFM